MKRHYRLPNGRYTTNPDEYAQAFKSLAEPIETATGWRLVSFDLSLTFDTAPGTLQMTLSQAQTLVKAIEALTSSMAEHLEEYAAGYGKGLQAGKDAIAWADGHGPEEER